MGNRHSRLSSDGEQRPRQSPTAKTRCPSCSQVELRTVDVDGELRVSVCDACNRSYGVDDSMDVETLRMLLEDKELCRDVQMMSGVSCASCLNHDADRFLIVGHDPDRLKVRCMNCDSVTDIVLKDWISDGADDALMSEMLLTLDITDEVDSGSLWYDDVSDHKNNYCITDFSINCVELLPFSCDCGNNEVDCFEKHFDANTGDLSRVMCLVCEREKVVDVPFLVECGHCNNDRKELFEKFVDDFGRITWLRCLVCCKRLCLPGQPETGRRRVDSQTEKFRFPSPQSGHCDDRRAKPASGVGLGWTKLADLLNIRRGDHIAWRKWYAIWHHAIVVEVPDSGHALTVIHYSGDVKKLDGHWASVRLETIDVDPRKENVYRIDYPGWTYPVEDVVQRACDRLDEAKYNPLTNNCEHFARWCKTGRRECGQVRTFTDRLGLVGRSALTKATQEVAAGPIEAAGGVGLSGIRARAGKVFGVTSGAARNIKFGALAVNVGINLALETAIFAKDAFVAYKKYKSGAISRDEFHRKLCQLGSECAGGLVAGTIFGLLGQILIPVPLVGCLMGSTLGNLIGRYIGAIAGNRIAAIKH